MERGSARAVLGVGPKSVNQDMRRAVTGAYSGILGRGAGAEVTGTAP